MKKTKVLLIALLALFPAAAFSQQGAQAPIRPVDQASGQDFSSDDSQGGLPSSNSIMDIKPSGDKDSNTYTIELRNIDLGDFFRVVAHDYGLNVIMDKEVQGTISASFTNITMEDALAKVSQMNNLAMEKNGDVILIKPNIITKQFILKNIQARDLLPNDSGNAPAASGSTAAGSALRRAANIYDLLSDKGRVLLGDQLNAVIVIDYPSNVKQVEDFLQLADQRVSMKVFKLNYLSVKDLFPDLGTQETGDRTNQRSEREAERNEIKEINTGTGSANK